MAWAVSILDCGTKYRPTSTFPAQTTLSLNCARGQWARFQVLVRSSAADQAGINVTATCPTGWEDLTIYREIPHNVQVQTRSDTAAGEWFDALVPKVDVFYGEERSAFPFACNRVSAVYESFTYEANDTPVARANTFGRAKPVVTGTFSGAGLTHYRLKIEAGATTFTWSDDGGSTWDATSVALNAGNPVSLNNGLSVTWTAAAGYEANEEWAFFADTGRTDAVWVQAWIPEDATPGSYTFTATVTATGQDAVTLTGNVTVHQCTIPRTSNFRSLYYASSSARDYVARGHYGIDSNSTHNTLFSKYVECGLRNRINICKLEPDTSVSSNNITSVSWATYKSFLEPFIEGTSNWPARLNLVYFKNPDNDVPAYTVNQHVSGLNVFGTAPEYDLTDAEMTYLDSYYSRWTGEGWNPEVLQAEVYEEPSFSGSTPPVSYTSSVFNTSPQIRAHFPGMKIGLSKRIVSAWAGQDLVDVWISPIYNFTPNMYPRSLYDTEVAAGNEVWAYISDMGFSTQNGIAATKWPTHEIDADTPRRRGFWWLLYDNDVTGSLESGVCTAYGSFVTTYTYPKRYDPWDCCAYYTNGNYTGGSSGMATYMYPGRHNVSCGPWLPSGIGGTTHIPIESIRLMNMCQGIEDWEIFKWTTANTDNPYYVKQQIQAAVGDKKCYWDVAPTAANMETARTNILFRKNPPIEEPPPVVEDPETYTSSGSKAGVIKGSFDPIKVRLRVTAKMWRDNRNG